MATTMAALRTGKIDYISDRRESPTWQDVASLKKTNPDLQISTFPVEGISVLIRADKEPFTDIRVRKALQLAVDFKAVAKGYYGGTVEPIPCGVINPLNKDWVVPYEEWPAQLQAEYGYDVDAAKALLTEAGYPDGFKTNCLMSQADPQQLVIIFQSFFKRNKC